MPRVPTSSPSEFGEASSEVASLVASCRHCARVYIHVCDRCLHPGRSEQGGRGTEAKSNLAKPTKRLGSCQCFLINLLNTNKKKVILNISEILPPGMVGGGGWGRTHPCGGEGVGFELENFLHTDHGMNVGLSWLANLVSVLRAVPRPGERCFHSFGTGKS